MIKKVILLFLFYFLISNNVNGQGNAGPEKVIKVFFDETQKQNINGMINCFAVEKFIQNYDFKKISWEIKSINLFGQLLPKQYPFYQEMNKYLRVSAFIKQIELYVLTIAANNESMNSPISVSKEERIDLFIKNINPSVLSSLKVLYIRNPLVKYDIDKLNELFVKQAKQIGANDSTERVALIKVNNKTYFIPFRLLKYKDEWQLESITSYISSDSLGIMSETDFLNNYPE